MIECMARAMSRGVQNRTVGAELRESEPWQAHRELTVDREWRHYEPFARDALEAMRDPGKAEIVAGESAIEYAEDSYQDTGGYWSDGTSDGDYAYACWTAMIDAALAEPLP